MTGVLGVVLSEKEELGFVILVPEVVEDHFQCDLFGVGLEEQMGYHWILLEAQVNLLPLKLLVA